MADEIDHTHRFPGGFALEPGAAVTLYTGRGEDTDTDSGLYWGSDGAVWNNDGDTVLVTTDGGETIVDHSYTGG